MFANLRLHVNHFKPQIAHNQNLTEKKCSKIKKRGVKLLKIKRS